MAVVHWLLLLAAVALYAAGRRRMIRQLLLMDGFVLGLAFFSLGTLLYARGDYGEPASKVLWLSSTALFSATAGVLPASSILRSVRSTMAARRPLRRELVGATALFIVIFNLGFSYLVFTKLFNSSLSALSTDEGHLLTVRKLIATGQRGYFFPGLVKQVRDVAAPALVFFLFVYSAARRSKSLVVSVIVSTLLAVFFGGQRTPVVILLWALFMGGWWARKLDSRPRNGRLSEVRSRGRVSGIRLAGYVGAGLAALTMISVLLGRVQGGNGLILQLVGEEATGIVERVVTTVPGSNIQAFEFVTARNFGPFQIWLANLYQLIPGTQTGLSNEIHEYLGGSFAGNAVLGFPVATYANAGSLGVVLLPFLSVVLLAVVDKELSGLNSPIVSSVRCVTIAYLPVCYGPAVFLLNGGLLLGAVWLWARLFERRRRHQSSRSSRLQ